MEDSDDQPERKGEEGKRNPAPWPPVSKYGDGVARTDVRTWKSAKEIQRILVEKHNSSVMTILNEQAQFCKTEAERIIDVKGTCVTELHSKGLSILADTVGRSFDETICLVMTWAAVFQEIVEKEDEKYQSMARLTQRFWSRCPEYGYPTRNAPEGSVYAAYPFVAEIWKKNSADYSAYISRSRSGKKGGRTDNKASPQSQQPGRAARPVSFVSTSLNKREQKLTKKYQRALSEWPDSLSHENVCTKERSGK